MYVINLLTIIIIIIFTIIIQVTKKTNIQTVLVLRRFNFVCFRDFSFANALIYGVIFFLIGAPTTEKVDALFISFRGASFFISLAPRRYVSANTHSAGFRNDANMEDLKEGFLLSSSSSRSSPSTRFTLTLGCTENEDIDFRYRSAICHRLASQGSAKFDNSQYANTCLSRSTIQRPSESFSSMLS